MTKKAKGSGIKAASVVDIRHDGRVYVVAAVFILLGLAVYANSMRGYFIWDDAYLIKDNSYIRNWRYLPEIFSKDIAAGAKAQANFYRPAQIASYLFDYSLWKLNATGYHLTNVFLHILAALCVFWLISILFRDHFLSLVTGMLFLVHPVQTEAVSYLSGRADMLAAIFMLGSFILYVKSIEKNTTVPYYAALALYILALLSRENAIIAPFILLLYHYSLKKEFDSKRFFPIAGIALGYIFIRLTALSYLLPHKVVNTTMLQRLPGFFVALTNYVRLLAAPFGLHMEYGDKLFSITDPRALFGIFILTVCVLFAIKIRKRSDIVFFSIAWFFLFLLPQSNIYPINAYMAEHWLYLPSIGAFLLLANALRSIYSKKQFCYLAVASCVFLVAFFSYLAARQNSYWRDPFSFYKRVLEYAPDSFRAHNSLGIQYELRGEIDKAIESYKKSIEANPNFVYAYHNLGKIYAEQGKYDEAILWYKKALEVSPTLGGTYHNLGNLYKDMRRFDEAVASYKKAIEIYPDYAEAYYNLGAVYKAMARPGDAIAAYRKAIEINPSYSSAYNNLGNIFMEEKRYAEGAVAYEQAIASDRTSPDPYNNLGALYSYTGNNQRALEMFLKAIEVDPNYAAAHNNAAVIYLDRRDYKSAIAHCDAAVRLGQPDQALMEELKPYR